MALCCGRRFVSRARFKCRAQQFAWAGRGGLGGVEGTSSIQACSARLGCCAPGHYHGTSSP